MNHGPVGAATSLPCLVMDAEMIPIDPRVRRQWRLEAVVATALNAFVLAGLAVLAPMSWVIRLALVVVATAGVAVGLQWLVSIRYRYWRYGLAEDVLILEHGVWTRRRSMTPYFRVQNVDVSQGPLERWLGLKRLTIRTASAFTNASIPGLDGQDAEKLRIRILERAGQDAAV